MIKAELGKHLIIALVNAFSSSEPTNKLVNFTSLYPTPPKITFHTILDDCYFIQWHKADDKDIQFEANTKDAFSTQSKLYQTRCH